MNPVAESLTGWENREAANQSIETVLTLVDETTPQPQRKPGHALFARGPSFGPRRAHGAGESPRPGNRHPGFRRPNPRSRRQSHRRRHGVSRHQQGAAIASRLHYQASHDALTGLINRREFENRLTVAVESVRTDPDCRHALLYLDLDQFKLVNDTCGHPAGDLLLKQITGVLQSRIRRADTLARLGGDEFGILLQSCSLDQALRIAESLRQAIRDYRFIWQDGVLGVGVSIGIVEISRETPTVANVMSAADVACYAAKDQGPQSRAAVSTRQRAGAAPRNALGVQADTRACDESRFELYYQPIVPIDANRVERRQFEVMLRLRDESGALIVPAEFIPAAERYNVMPSIDRWVVRQALEQLVHRPDSGRQALYHRRESLGHIAQR
jgi:diguanylate cyclase (GGDEF)-like protein